MTNLIPPTLDEQIAEVEREIALRRQVYARWVEVKKISQQKANWQLGTMEAVLKTLRQAKEWHKHD